MQITRPINDNNFSIKKSGTKERQLADFQKISYLSIVSRKRALRFRPDGGTRPALPFWVWYTDLL
jgi:hypothetical protein